MLQGGFERRSVLESDDAFANDAVAVQENRGGDALDAEALLHFGRAHEQRVVDIELEKTLRGKVGKQTFPLRLGIPQKTRDSHFPTAATTTALRLHFKWRDDPPHGYILKWLDARAHERGHQQILRSGCHTSTDKRVKRLWKTRGGGKKLGR